MLLVRVVSCCVVLCGVMSCGVGLCCAVALVRFVVVLGCRVVLRFFLSAFLWVCGVGRVVSCGSCAFLSAVCVFVALRFSCRVGRVVWLNPVLASYLFSVFA